MTLDELRYATRATKEAARAWAPAYILDDPCDAPPAKPLQPTTPHHHQQQPQQAHHSRIPQPQQTYPAPAQQHPVPARHQATAAPAQPKPRQARETVFDITDSSTVSSVDSLAEWKAHQAHLQQQQARRQQHAGARLQSPYIPSPATSPSVSSAACPEFTTPTLPSPAAFAKSRIQQQQSHVRGPAQQTLRSDFSLSDSDESSMDEDDMEYAGGRSPLYHSTNARLQHHSPQQQYHTRQSPNPNVSFGSRPTHYDYATRSKNSPPPPLTPQAPRTPRQAFTTAASAAERRRKQSIESDSSSSSISSDASWTGLPPTPDTPVFAKRHTAAVIAAKGNGSPSPMTHLQPPEKQSMLSSLTSPIAIAGAKLKMAF